MLKRFVAVVACVGMLQGCSTLAALGVSQATITAIQQAAVTACGFLPTVETVVGIVSGGMSAIPGQVASAICAAVAANQAPAGMATGRFGAPTSGPRAIPPNAMVGKTPVQGMFVR